MQGYVYKRGRTFSYIVDTGKDPVTGKRKQKTKGGFRDKTSAQAALRKVLVELDEGEYLEPSKETFSSYIEYWFRSHYQKRIKETTVASRKYLLEKHMIRENPFADKPLDKITTFDIDAFYNLKVDEEYSTNYIRKMHQMLYQAFQQAVKWEKIKQNPVINADPPTVKRQEMVIWNFADIHSFLAACQKERHYMAFLLAIYTGMRRGEILGLKWSDIDFSNKVIHVERSLAFVPKKGYVLTTLKTKKSKRKVPIPDHLINVLLSHKKRQQEWKAQWEGHYNDQNLVICTEAGTVQDPRNVLRVMKRLIDVSGVPKIRFHDIRHTHASILIAEGVDLVKVANRLGHSNPKITLEYYAHLMPNEDDEVADIFHRALEASC